MLAMKICLLTTLLLAGVRCMKDSLFVYSQLGGDAVLPCTNLNSSHCSFVSWTFYKEGLVRYTYEVSGGRVSTDSDKSNRTSIMSNCSLALSGLQVDDAGSYSCLEHNEEVTNVYLSLLTVTSPSSIMELRPGGRLVLSCLLFTYYDPGSCKSSSSSLFKLSWRSEVGAVLQGGSLASSGVNRQQLMEHGRCNVTLITTLQADDHDRRWRCQVDATNSHIVEFMDFRSTFWSEPAHRDPQTNRSEVTECSAPPPISRMVLCAALPLMVVTVGLFTWRLDRGKARAAAPAGFRLQEIS